MHIPRSTWAPIVALALGVTLVRATSSAFELGPEHGPALEPALRARVALGDEVLELELGETARTADGRTLLVELLPTRTFAAPGAFSFGFPREWSYAGTRGVPGPEDGWWSLSGDRAFIYLRRHTGEPRAALEEYVRNLRSLASSTPAPAEPLPVEMTLGGRRLAGRAVEFEGGVRGPARHERHEVYGWRQREGVSWLLVVQRHLDQPIPTWLATDSIVFESTETGLVARVDDPEATSPPTQPGLDALLASWRWE